MQKLIKKVVKKGKEGDFFRFFCEPPHCGRQDHQEPALSPNRPTCLTHAPFTWQRQVQRPEKKIGRWKKRSIRFGPSFPAVETILRTKEAGIRPLCFAPIHYLELPELFIDFIVSVTGKSPSTTGAGSGRSLDQKPFNVPFFLFTISMRPCNLCCDGARRIRYLGRVCRTKVQDQP